MASTRDKKKNGPIDKGPSRSVPEARPKQQQAATAGPSAATGANKNNQPPADVAGPSEYSAKGVVKTVPQTPHGGGNGGRAGPSAVTTGPYKDKGTSANPPTPPPKKKKNQN